MHRCIVQHSTPATQSEGRSPRATPATQSDGRCRKVPCPTQSEGRCRQVPRLPRRVKVDVAKYHACHANGQTGTKRATRASPVPKWHACHAECASMPSATPAMQSDGPCRQVPRLPSASPATQTAAATTAPNGNQARHQSQRSAISGTLATQNARRCRHGPRLPRKVTVHVAKCHACNAE